MKTEVVGVDERRLAALTLHALAEGDRTWILDQVGPIQREELQSLLCELASLGIPRDRALVKAALVPAAEGELPLKAPGNSLRAEPKHLAGILRSEPTAIVARCLALIDEGQRAEVMRLLPDDVRASVQSAQPAGPAPALTAALARIVSERLVAEPPKEPSL